jgi:hypothetical protein
LKTNIETTQPGGIKSGPQTEDTEAIGSEQVRTK